MHRVEQAQSVSTIMIFEVWSYLGNCSVQDKHTVRLPYTRALVCLDFFCILVKYSLYQKFNVYLCSDIKGQYELVVEYQI